MTHYRPILHANSMYHLSYTDHFDINLTQQTNKTPIRRVIYPKQMIKSLLEVSDHK